MLKTIKTIKYMRLDELIKYIFDNDIRDESFTSNILSASFHEFKNKVYVHSDGTISLGLDKFNSITDRDLFRVEEPITKKTEFLGVQEVYLDIKEQKIHVENYIGRWSVEDVLETHDGDTKCLQIYVYINKKKELIWEREEEC